MNTQSNTLLNLIGASYGSSSNSDAAAVIWIVIAIAAVVCGAIGYMIGERAGEGPAGLILGLILGIFGLLIAAFVFQPKEKQPKAQQSTPSFPQETKTSPETMSSKLDALEKIATLESSGAINKELAQELRQEATTAAPTYQQFSYQNSSNEKTSNTEPRTEGGIPLTALGKETVDFLVAGTDKYHRISQDPVPETSGWFPDPLLPTHARYFDGSHWTGLQRKITN